MSSLKTNDLILINQNEILNFCKEKEGLVDLVNASIPLIKSYFPKAIIYLEFHKDPEFKSMNSLYLFVYNGKDSFENDEKIFSDFIKEYYKLEDSFSNDIKSCTNIDLLDDDLEYRKLF